MSPQDDSLVIDAPAVRPSRLQQVRRSLHGRTLTVLTVSYFLVAIALMIIFGGEPTPDMVAIVGLVLALLLAKPRTFLKDWVPFVILFLAYEFLRGLVPGLGWTVHVQPLIQADRWLSGRLPIVILQDHLWREGYIPWYDWVFTLVYVLHFALPLGFALVLWVRDRADFRRFMVALLGLSFAGFLTYVLYPAMPPWMAANQGLIAPLHDVLARTWGPLMDGPGVPTLFFIMRPNLVAAMPSLHAAYPMLVYLYAVRCFGWKGNLFLPYLLTVWVGVIYTINHWAIDVIVGALYALVAFGVTEYAFHRWGRHEEVGVEDEPAPV